MRSRLHGDAAMIDKMAKKIARRDRALLRLLGFDTRKMTAADIAEGAEAVARISRCGCGADARRPKAEADFRAFCHRWPQ
jgi:hypothetical protein